MNMRLRKLWYSNGKWNPRTECQITEGRRILARFKRKECSCKNVELGSYDSQVEMSRPTQMTGRTEGSASETICVDRCISNEIEALWKAGIRTTGCCCGHKKVNGFIGVIDDDIPVMKQLGYAVRPNEIDMTRRDSFHPKSIRRVSTAIKPPVSDRE